LAYFLIMTGRLSCSASLATCLALLRLGVRPQDYFILHLRDQ
jgi:hypothetical protein